ncbi:MAG: type II secretion system protein [Planctomycetes bacterium]|nr:type II secretion system protein [Planctomycetota bacterium]
MADATDPRTNGGFTLAEMLAALGILLVGVVALLGALSSSVGQRRTTDARLAAARVCEGALQRVQYEAVRRRGDGESDLDLEIVKLEDQTVPGFEGMTWSATAVVDELRPDLWMVRLEVRWLEEGENASEVFLRILPRSLPLGPRVERFRAMIEQTSAR